MVSKDQRLKKKEEGKSQFLMAPRGEIYLPSFHLMQGCPEVYIALTLD
jgi:hypothetical protein